MREGVVFDRGGRRIRPADVGVKGRHCRRGSSSLLFAVDIWPGSHREPDRLDDRPITLGTAQRRPLRLVTMERNGISKEIHKTKKSRQSRGSLEIAKRVEMNKVLPWSAMHPAAELMQILSAWTKRPRPSASLRLPQVRAGCRVSGGLNRKSASPCIEPGENDPDELTA